MDMALRQDPESGVAVKCVILKHVIHVILDINIL